MDETIAAISTPIGAGGIAIVRLSGPRALAVADAIFHSRQGRASEFPTHTVHLGEIRDEARVLDQVLLTVMRAPRSYTREDVVEIHCHGGTQNARSVLQRAVASGARLAQPGEFTQRAFLNGRIDLTQAEAVMDLIQARTERAQTLATRALEGHLSKKLNRLQDRLIAVLANVEAHIDFPEEDITPATFEQLQHELVELARDISQLLATSREGQILRDGISVTIVGRPNVGKSSLLNSLLGSDRAIVSPIPGTTRDVIEEFTSIRGLPIRLADTAGVRETRGQVEAIGVAKTHKQLAISTITLHVMDCSRPYAPADMALAGLYNGQSSIQVLHKSDLPNKLSIPAEFPVAERVRTSSLTGEGLEHLKTMIERMALAETGEPHAAEIAINARQTDVLIRALGFLSAAASKLKAREVPEIIAQELRLGLGAVGEVLGKTTPEDVLNAIFSKFCIGK